MRLLRTGENVQSYPARHHRDEAVHLFVSDGLTCRNALPRIARPYFDRVFFNVLAVIEPFHRCHPVNADRFREVDLQHGMMRSGRR